MLFKFSKRDWCQTMTKEFSFSVFHWFPRADLCQKVDTGPFALLELHFCACILFWILTKLSNSLLLAMSSYYRIWQTTISETHCSLHLRWKKSGYMFPVHRNRCQKRNGFCWCFWSRYDQFSDRTSFQHIQTVQWLKNHGKKPRIGQRKTICTGQEGKWL